MYLRTHVMDNDELLGTNVYFYNAISRVRAALNRREKQRARHRA